MEAMDKPVNEEAERLPEDFTSLEKAALIVYEHVYRRITAVDQQTACNVMAQALCDLSPLYAYEGRMERMRALRTFELTGGVVCDGGGRLAFPDRRPELVRVAIRTEDMRKVIQTLIESGIAFAEIEAQHGTATPEPAADILTRNA